MLSSIFRHMLRLSVQSFKLTSPPRCGNNWRSGGDCAVLYIVLTARQDIACANWIWNLLSYLIVGKIEFYPLDMDNRNTHEEKRYNYR